MFRSVLYKNFLGVIRKRQILEGCQGRKGDKCGCDKESNGSQSCGELK